VIKTVKIQYRYGRFQRARDMLTGPVLKRFLEIRKGKNGEGIRE
jgi:hypothetical protein